MSKHPIRLAALAAASAAAILAGAGTIAASAAPAAAGHRAAAATERFQMMQTSATASTAGVIAYGRFTAHGVDHTGNKVDTFVFPDGTIRVAHAQGKGSQSFNPRTCLFAVTQPGTYRLEDGTGAYKGITGSGTYHMSILAIGPRSGGKCTQRGAPVAWQQRISAAGSVHLAR